MHQHIVTGRIANLVFFSLVEFGTRASFKIEGAAQRPVVCAVDGDLARKFMAHYREGDIVVVSGLTSLGRQPRPPKHRGSGAFACAPCARWKRRVSQHEGTPD